MCAVYGIAGQTGVAAVLSAGVAVLQWLKWRGEHEQHCIARDCHGACIVIVVPFSCCVFRCAYQEVGSQSVRHKGTVTEAAHVFAGSLTWAVVRVSHAFAAYLIYMCSSAMPCCANRLMSPVYKELQWQCVWLAWPNMFAGDGVLLILIYSQAQLRV